MGFFEDVSFAIENTAKEIGDKAKTIAKESKKAIEDAALREKLTREYEKLGRLVAGSTVLSTAAKHSGKEYARILEKIDEYKEKIESNQSKYKKCTCGKTISKDVLYCPHCGIKQE